MLCVGGTAAADHWDGQEGTHAASVGVLEAGSHKRNWSRVRLRGAEEHQLPSAGAGQQDRADPTLLPDHTAWMRNCEYMSLPSMQTQ